MGDVFGLDDGGFGSVARKVMAVLGGGLRYCVCI